MDYQEGHIKRNPETLESATRTHFPQDDFPGLSWLVCSTKVGPRNAPTSEVESWEDVYTPPVAE
jgi:hypothetical protein